MTSHQAHSHSAGDRVRIKDNGDVATILMLDPNPDEHARVEGNQTWYLKFDNGSEGGGWKDLDLIPLPTVIPAELERTIREAARGRFGRDGELEFDDFQAISPEEEEECYQVKCWVWVSAEQAGCEDLDEDADEDNVERAYIEAAEHPYAVFQNDAEASLGDDPGAYVSGWVEIPKSFVQNFAAARVLWTELGKVAVNDDGAIQNQFLGFEPGTSREDIWHWFEDTFELSVAEDLMRLL